MCCDEYADETSDAQVTMVAKVQTMERPLLPADRDQVLDLLEAGLQEVPAYRWLLGENAGPDSYRWYGEILFTEHLPAFRGRFTADDELIALTVVAGPEHQLQPVDDDLATRSRHHVARLDGFAERFAELGTKVKGASLVGTLTVVLAVVHPDHRRSGALATLVQPVLDDAARDGVVVTTSTADAQMKAVYERKWSGRVYDEFTLTDGPTVWFLRLDPPG